MIFQTIQDVSKRVNSLEFRVKVLQSVQLLLTVILIAVALLVNKAHSAVVPKIKAVALAASNAYDVEYDLVLAIIEVESQFNPHAVGGCCGEIGLMQLYPKYHPSASFDIYTNIFLGVKYLSELKAYFEPRYGNAWFVSYNWGYRYPPVDPSRTVYYRKVMLARGKYDIR